MTNIVNSWVTFFNNQPVAHLLSVEAVFDIVEEVLASSFSR